MEREAEEQGSLSSDSRSLHPCSPLIWVAGYCNDIFDYVPTRRIQAEGGYEGGRANLWNWIPAPFTEDVEDRITRCRRQACRSGGWELGARGWG